MVQLGPGGVRTVLLVDDDPRQLKFGLRAARGRPWNLSVAIDAREALLRATEAPPELAIVDLFLGHPSGFYVFRELVARWPQIVVAMASCDWTVATAIHASNIGVPRLLQKPICIDTIINAVENGVELPDPDVNEHDEEPRSQ